MRAPRSKQANKIANQKAKEQMSHIGPLTTKQFKTMQEHMDSLDEAARYQACYNLLVIMNEMEDDEDNFLQPFP